MDYKRIKGMCFWKELILIKKIYYNNLRPHQGINAQTPSLDES